MQTALVTGASRRLGLELCKSFLRKGMKVIALSRAASSELKQLTQLGNIDIILCQNYDMAALQGAIAALNVDEIDILINNASLYQDDRPLNDAEGEQFYLNLYQVHMLIPAMLMQWFETKRQFNNSCIINITDIFALNPDPKSALYCSTKAGLENLTQSFAKKLAPNIRVNSIMPGPVKFLPCHSNEAKLGVLSETLLPFEAGFEPVLQSIFHIIDNPYLTGGNIKVDGGRSLIRR